MPSDLQSRCDALRREMVEQARKVAALENHWLFYSLLGWQFFIFYFLNFGCVHLWNLQSRWILLVIKVAQFGLAVATYFAIVRRNRVERSPLERPNRDLWLIFILLCAYVDILNIVADHPLYTMLPAFTGLAAFAFAVMTRVFTKKFMLAGNFMVIVGLLMVAFPTYALLIYGSAWLIILQTLGVWFWMDRKRWLPAAADPTKLMLTAAAGEHSKSVARAS